MLQCFLLCPSYSAHSFLWLETFFFQYLLLLHLRLATILTVPPLCSLYLPLDLPFLFLPSIIIFCALKIELYPSYSYPQFIPYPLVLFRSSPIPVIPRSSLRTLRCSLLSSRTAVTPHYVIFLSPLLHSFPMTNLVSLSQICSYVLFP